MRLEHILKSQILQLGVILHISEFLDVNLYHSSCFIQYLQRYYNVPLERP
jgi:hypothetical protein